MFFKNKRLSKILCPIEYYSSNNKIQKSKVKTDEIVSLLRIILLNLLESWNSSKKLNFEMANSLIKYLLENHPKAKHTLFKKI